MGANPALYTTNVHCFISFGGRNLMDERPETSLEIEEKNRIQLILQENESIKKENEKLLEQFNDALNISQTVDYLSDENKRLSETIVQLQNEKDEISKRLEIATQRLNESELQQKETIKQLENKYETAKNKILSQHSQNEIEISSRIKELEEKQADYQEEIRNLNLVIRDLQQDNDKIYGAISIIFNQNIKTSEQLLRFLSTLNEEKLKKQLQEAQTQCEEQFEEKIDAVSMSSDSRRDIENEIREAQKSIAKLLGKQHREEIEKIEEKHKNEIDQLKINFGQIAQTNVALKKKCKEIAEESEQRLSEVTALKTKLELTIKQHQKDELDEIYLLNEKLKKKTDENEELDSEITHLKKQLSTVVSRNAVLQEDINNFREENIKLDQQNDILKTQNESLKKSADLNLEQMNNLQNKFQDLSSNFKVMKKENEKQHNDIHETNLELSKAKQQITFLQAQIEQQKEDLSNMGDQNNSLLETVSEYEKQKQSLQSEILTNTSKIAELTKEKAELHDKLLKTETPISEDSLLPLGYWSCKEFPKELSQLVDDIAKNETYKAPTKLRNVLLVVAKWYTAKTERIQAECDFLKQEKENSAKKLQKFVDNIIDCFSNMNMNLTELYNQEFLQVAIKNYVKELEQKSKEETEKNRRIETNFLQILTDLNANTVDEAMTLVRELKVTCATLKKCVSKQRKQIKKLSNQLESEEEEKEKIIRVKDEQIEDLTNTVEDTKANITKMKNKIAQIENDVIVKGKTINDKHEKELKEKDIAYDSERKMIINKMEELKKSYEKVKQENREIKQKLQNSEQEKEQLELQMDEISALCEERNQLILNLKTQLKDQRKEMKARIKEERNNIASKIMESNGILKEENNSYKATLSDLNSSISALEEEKQEKEEENSLLQLKLHKITMQYNSLNDELKREKELNKSQSKAQKLALESQYHQEIMDLKSEIAHIKRDLISEIGLEFCSLFDINSKLNESNFEQFLKKMKTKLLSLLEQDHKIRTLLSLGPKQSIADAVEILLLDHK